MREDVLAYIRSHKDLYRLLREESHYYEDIYRDNSVVYQLNRIAKEKYGTRFVDKIEKFGNKLEILSSFLDIFQ